MTTSEKSIIGNNKITNTSLYNPADISLKDGDFVRKPLEVTRVKLGNGLQKCFIYCTDSKDNVIIKQNTDGSLSIQMDSIVKIKDSAGSGLESYSKKISKEDAENLVIVAGDGDDKIFVDSSVMYNLTIDGGNGRDYIQGGSGSDTILGGAGNDTIYGMGGNDKIEGGEGDDYIDGGLGDDDLSGDKGNDIVVGGKGDDKVLGGDGRDVIVGCKGKDSYDDDISEDKVFADNDDDISKKSGDNITKVEVKKNDDKMIGRSIKIVGDAAFKARVESDLELLRSIPEGRKFLEAIDYSGNKITIEETNFCYMECSSVETNFNKYTGKNGKGANVTVGYNTTISTLYSGEKDWQRIYPIIGLYHELVHAYNAVTGTIQSGTHKEIQEGSVSNLEQQCVGLPFNGTAYDNDNDPKTSPSPDNPEGFTENGFRKLLNLPKRTSYEQ